MSGSKGRRPLSSIPAQPSAYPPVIIEDPPPGFPSDAFPLYSAVKNVNLKLANREHFQAWEREFFKLQAQSSFLEAIPWFLKRWLKRPRRSPHDWNEIRSVAYCDQWGDPRTGRIERRISSRDILLASLHNSVGHALAQSVDLSRFETVVPMVMFNAAPVGPEWRVSFTALTDIPSESAWRTPIAVDGAPLAVRGHFVARLCRRFWPDWSRYASALDAHLFLCSGEWLRTEPARLNDGQAAISVWKKLDPGMSDYKNAQQISGISSGQPLWLRLGYAPVKDRGNFVIATTLLLPGFEGTPEAARIQSGPPHLRTLASTLTEDAPRLRFSIGGEIVRALTWLHREAGIEQVRSRWQAPLAPQGVQGAGSTP